MTANVTVVTSATSHVLVPFTSAGNAAAVQAVLDAGANAVALGGIMKYHSPLNQGQANPLPNVTFFGGIVDTVPAALNFGILNSKYTSFVNAGSGLAVAIGGINTTLVSGQNASTIYINQSTAGEAYISGRSNVLGNAFSISNLTAFVDGIPGGGLGSTTLILDDTAGGSMNVSMGEGGLIALQGGGADAIIGQAGTLVVLASKLAGAGSGVATVSAANAGVDLWVGAQGGRVIVNPGAGNAFVFQGAPGVENAVTLFGGTGRSTVLGMNGSLQGGSAGGSLLQSGLTAGAATLGAGGAGDIVFVQAAGNTALTGNGLNVVITAGAVGTGSGGTFVMGSGSGSVFGTTNGHSVFNFGGAGNYTVAGFHDTTVPVTSGSFLRGSIYNLTAVGNAGTITIADFLPQQAVGLPIFDVVNLGGRSVTALTSTVAGGGFNNTAILSDGTRISFLNTAGQVHSTGTSFI